MTNDFPYLINPGIYEGVVNRIHVSKKGVYSAIVDLCNIKRVLTIRLPILDSEIDYARLICNDYQLKSLSEIDSGKRFYIDVSIAKRYNAQRREYIVYNAGRIATQRELE